MVKKGWHSAVLEMQLEGEGCGGEATPGSGPPDLGVDTASATLKLYGPGEDQLSCLYILTSPLSCQAPFSHSGNGVVLLLPTSQEKSKGSTVCGSSFQPANVLG